MTCRSGRADALVDRPALLARPLPLGRHRPNGADEACRPLYYSGATLVAAIDALAQILTGERDYFALKAHSIGGPNSD